MSRRPSAGPFHGLAPYTEEEAGLLFGRDAERAALLSLAQQRSAPTILITGEVAAGKTSLLRAGLLPAAEGAGLLPLYLELGPGWEAQLRAGVARLIGRPISADDAPIKLLAGVCRERKVRPILILDPVEMILWMDDAEVEAIRRVVLDYRVIEGLGVILAVDRGNAHAIARLDIGATGLPPEHTITLGRLERARAEQVMEQTILAGGGYLEAGLPQLMASDLTTSGPVLPAALQVVGHAAMVRKVTSHKTYARAGGAVTLTAFYVEELTARAGGWPARKVLAVLAEQPSPRILVGLEDVARGAGLAVTEAQHLLETLEEQGLVRNFPAPPAATLQTGPVPASSGHTILHPYLRQPVRDFVAPVHRGRARARLTLQRRIHNEQVLRPMEAVNVRRFLGAGIDARERVHLERSVRIWAAAAALLVALPMLVLVAFYLVMSSAAHLDVAGPPGGRRIVLESGTPGLDGIKLLLPGRFHQVEVDTGITLASAPAPLARAVGETSIRGRLRGPARPMPLWSTRLLDELPPARRAAFLILAGEREAGGRLLLQAAAQPEARRRAMAWATLLLERSEVTLRVLEQAQQDARPEVRLLALERARRLGREALPLVRAALRDRDGQVRQAAIAAVGELEPRDALPLLRPLLADPEARVQQEALSRLEGIAKLQPLLVLDALLELGLTGSGSPGARPGLDALLQRLLTGDRKRVAGHLAGLLARGQSPARRELLLRWLASLADQLAPAQVRRSLAGLTQDRSPLVRAAAISLQARFEQPDAAEARLKELARTTQPRAEATALRRAAAVGLGLIGGPLTRERLNLLKALVRDREASVRGAAVRSLLRVGQLGLLEAARAMKQGSADLAEAALQMVCDGSIASNRVATTILGVAWKLKRHPLRQRALRCAQSLADASLRLRIWLADEAAKDKDHQVRRAGAEAGALAIREGGPQYLRLGKLYLRDPDPELRRAMLEAIAQHPPASASFLFELVEKLTHDPEPTVRAASAPVVQLAAHRPAAAIGALQRLLADSDPRVRRAAVAAAARISREEPERARLEEPFAELITRAAVDDAVGAVQVAGALELPGALRRAATHPDGRVRAAAVEALVPLLPAREALPVIEAALRDPQPTVREVALRGVGKLAAGGDEPLARLLGRASFSNDPALRAAAFHALGQVRGRAAATAFEVLGRAARSPSEERRRLAISALGELAHRDGRASDLLVAAAEDPALDVRQEAQRALGGLLGRYCPLADLWALLLGSEREGLARRLAVAAIAQHGRREGTFRLRQLVQALPADAPVVTRIGAQLALALARTSDPPEQAIAWLYGW